MPEKWLNPHQERALQRKETQEIKRLPIQEQTKMLERDAEILAEIIEFGRDVRILLENYKSANAIPDADLKAVARGTDYPPGMAFALARVFERKEKEKRSKIN